MALFVFNHAARKTRDVGTGYRRDTRAIHQRVDLDFLLLLMFDHLTCWPYKFPISLRSDISATFILCHRSYCCRLCTAFSPACLPWFQKVSALSQKNNLQAQGVERKQQMGEALLYAKIPFCHPHKISLCL